MKSSDLDNITTIVVAGVALYVVYNIVQGVQAVNNLGNSIGDAITSPFTSLENAITGNNQ